MVGGAGLESGLVWKDQGRLLEAREQEGRKVGCHQPMTQPPEDSLLSKEVPTVPQGAL